MQKRIFTCLTTILLSAAISNTLSAQDKYQLKTVNFDSRDNTKTYVLKNKIENIKYDTVFESKSDFEKYLAEIYQELENTRLLKDIEYEYEITETSDDGINIVSATYTFHDSKSMIVFPKPKFDTNSGIEVKFKLKDNNFLGLMNDLNIDVNMNFGNEDYPDDYSKVTAGFNFAYDYPFYVGKLKNTWSNDFEFDWEIDGESPEFNYTTGLSIGIPLTDDYELDLSLNQSIVKDHEYDKYDDGLYYIENAELSLPLKIAYIGNTTPVKYKPFVDFTYNWDKDGINSKNRHLNKTPLVSPGQGFSINKVDWIGPNNFRQGYSVSATQKIGWNFNGDSLQEKFMPSVDGSLEMYYSLKYIGIAVRVKGYAALNNNKNIGEDLRGATNNQTFEFENGEPGIDDDNYALETPAAITFNFDMPIHVITTHWLDWSFALFGPYETKPTFVRAVSCVPRALMRYLDFEMQINPFVDIGLIKNRKTGTNFDLNQAIYTGGLEVLVYPAKWKSFVIRGSAGVDISKKILNGKSKFDSSWRDGGGLEIYFGLGLHF